MSAPLDLQRRMNLSRRNLNKLGDALGMKKKFRQLRDIDDQREKLADQIVGEMKAAVKTMKATKPRARKVANRPAEKNVVNFKPHPRG